MKRRSLSKVVICVASLVPSIRALYSLTMEESETKDWALQYHMTSPPPIFESVTCNGSSVVSVAYPININEDLKCFCPPSLINKYVAWSHVEIFLIV